jgi:hypothetical protein
MTWFRFLGIWSRVKIKTVRIHYKQLALKSVLIEDLGDYRSTGLCFMLAPWGAISLIMNNSANTWFLIHLEFPHVVTINFACSFAFIMHLVLVHFQLFKPINSLFFFKGTCKARALTIHHKVGSVIALLHVAA